MSESKENILLCITGSIAAYKSLETISSLVKLGHQVRVMCSKSALKFIGEASIEALCGHAPLVDTFDNHLAHIDLPRWADLTLIAPATANTINKCAYGIADSLIPVTYLAHDKDTPILVAPAMNTQMYLHPATQEGLGRVHDQGAIILPTDSGRLACGEIGPGKLLDPNALIRAIRIVLQAKQSPSGLQDLRGKHVCITGGATKIPIDDVRHLGNMSSGKTASILADIFALQGAHVTYIKSQEAKPATFPVEEIEFDSFDELDNRLTDVLTSENIDFLIHAAAVSDYRVKTVVDTNGNEF
ncbi:bifunctional phosphopantothenoylcysteine decarboxylase/phosphopantothenate--cysteine ligase CoaBC, partial [Myxococcota bacterium]|nr:bifunctional phosphopantothenoylcysteine decarboxylase/phosphopantothenate--cysteine ligase CoaBC [Myxococcota bacterium]